MGVRFVVGHRRGPGHANPILEPPGGMPIQDQLGDALGVPRRAEDFPVIVPQQLQIAIEVSRVGFQIVGDAEFRAEEGARQFRPQLLAGIRR